MLARWGHSLPTTQLHIIVVVSESWDCAAYMSIVGCNWTRGLYCPGQKENVAEVFLKLGVPTIDYECCCERQFWRDCDTQMRETLVAWDTS